MERINIRYTGTVEEGIVNQYENKSYVLHYPCSSTSFCSPYEVTLKPGFFHIECFGGSGIDYGQDFSAGGITSGKLFVSSEQIFYVYVGSRGALGHSPSYNGGGKGSSNGYSGGGATDIRTADGHFSSFPSLISRIMVAGGGGGHSTYPSDSYIRHFVEKGYSGGLVGGRGIVKASGASYPDLALATGGTQINGGIGCDCVTPCQYQPKSYESDGQFGMGGNTTRSEHSGGGGGGYFGGGAGHFDDYITSGGGGGSSYISGFGECISVSPDSTIDHIIPTSSSIHFSGHKFYDSFMMLGSFGHGSFHVADITDSLPYDFGICNPTNLKGASLTISLFVFIFIFLTTY